MTSAKVLLRSPALSFALVASAATATATITMVSSVLRPTMAWPPRVQPLVDVTAVPDSNWGAPWDRLAGAPETFQQEALVSLVQTLALLGAAVVVVAGLALWLYWLSWIMDRWPGLGVRSALGAPFGHLFRSAAYPLLGLTALGSVIGLVLGTVTASLVLAERPESLSHAGGFSAGGLGGSAVLTAGSAVASSAVVAALVLWLRRGATSLARLTGDRTTRSQMVIRLQGALAVLQVAGVLAIGAACALIINATRPPAGDVAEAAEDLRTIVPMRMVGAQAASVAARSAAYQQFLDTARDRGLPLPTVASPGAWLGLGKRLSVRGFCNNCYSGLNFVAVSSAEVRVIAAGPGSLTAMATPVHGREFTADDSVRAPRVAVLSDLAARQLFPRADPVGRTVRLGTGRDTDYTVVGVVRPAVAPGLGSGGDTLPIVYVALLQHPPAEVEVVTHRAQVDGLRAVADTFANHELRPALREPGSLGERLVAAGAPLRWFRSLFVWLGIAAAVLSVGALATLMVETVTLRLREIAVRMAVGARPRHIVAWVVWRTLRIVGAGFLLGATGARAVEEFLRPHLSAGAVGDLSVVAGLAAPLGVLAILASLIPALRASRLDPAAIWRELRS